MEAQLVVSMLVRSQRWQLIEVPLAMRATSPAVLSASFSWSWEKFSTRLKQTH
ncbi:MAG: hypothetical protein KDA87_11355 [Planctomycetales bacterium]|nr:hypothetical protein [Planctomycetales bacterium]